MAHIGSPRDRAEMLLRDLLVVLVRHGGDAAVMKETSALHRLIVYLTNRLFGPDEGTMCIGRDDDR